MLLDLVKKYFYNYIACLHQIFATFLKSSLFGTTCPFPGPCWARTARSISAWFSRIAANMLTTVP